MAKTETTAKRVTASSVVTKYLLLKRVPTDEEIISSVRKESGSKTFNAASLAWYKTQARQGKLRGQSGKKYVIAQAKSKSYTAKGRAAAKDVVEAD